MNIFLDGNPSMPETIVPWMKTPNDHIKPTQSNARNNTKQSAALTQQAIVLDFYKKNIDLMHACQKSKDSFQ